MILLWTVKGPSRFARFRSQLEQGSLQYIARNALQCMAYLLRRRRYAEDFLPPDSTSAVQAKQLLDRAADMALTSGLTILGGAVDVPAVMRTIRDYIDRRGTGRILLVTDG